jgi:hypothetical protein
MDLRRNESNESDGISNDKMYLHIAICNILFLHLSMLSRYLTISDIVRQDGKGQTPIHCMWVQGTASTVGNSTQGIA